VTFKNPLIVALDVSERAEALSIARELAPIVGGIKLGLEYFTSVGRAGVEEIVALGVPVFLDLKLHDIPNTVAKAVAAVTTLGVSMLTLHASGGKAMLKAASDAANEASLKSGKKKPILLAVTMLTSLSESDQHDIGFTGTLESQVLRLAKLSMGSGVDGCVCSPLEVGAIRGILGNKPVLVVPGIRLEGGDSNDQVRMATPEKAIEMGASYIVAGRPILHAKNKGLAAQAIVDRTKIA
jgi:orotidine-5'-phosphate decarboxylase